MSRRTPFPFADYYHPEARTDHNGLIPGYIEAYESALATEYMSGDVDVASYHEGLREAYETVLVDLLGIDQAVMDAYWGRTPRPVPDTFDLPVAGSEPLIGYDQVAEWSGHRLNAEQWYSLAAAIPNSSIPESIGTIVHTITERG